MDRTFYVNCPFGAGVQTPIITGIPPQGRLGYKRLKRLDCALNLVIDSAAVADAVSGRRMMEAIQNMTLKPKAGLPIVNNLSGWALRALQWNLTGRAPQDPADIPANANTTTTVRIPFTILLDDDRTKQPKDGGVPCAFVSKGVLQINWQPKGYFGTGLTINAATSLDIDFVHGEAHGDVEVGQRVTYELVGPNTFQNTPIQPGMITDLLIIPKDGAAAKAYDENTFATISYDEDGDMVHNNTPPDLLIDAFNASLISDFLGLYPTLSADQTEGIPLVWPRRSSSDMGDYDYAAQQFNFLGTVGSGNPSPNDSVFVLRRILPVDVADSAEQISAAAPDVGVGTAQLGLQVAGKLGDDNAAHAIVHVPTNSKVPLAGAGQLKAGIYGRFLGRKISPTNLAAAAAAASNNKPPKV